MDKQMVIDYIMNTPGNTNPAVLGTILEEYKGESGGGGEPTELVIWTNPDPTQIIQRSFEVPCETENYDFIKIEYLYSNNPEYYDLVKDKPFFYYLYLKQEFYDGVNTSSGLVTPITIRPIQWYFHDNKIIIEIIGAAIDYHEATTDSYASTPTKISLIKY